MNYMESEKTPEAEDATRIAEALNGHVVRFLRVRLGRLQGR